MPAFGALIVISILSIMRHLSTTPIAYNDGERSVFALCILYLWIKNLEWASAFTLVRKIISV